MPRIPGMLLFEFVGGFLLSLLAFFTIAAIDSALGDCSIGAAAVGILGMPLGSLLGIHLANRLLFHFKDYSRLVGLLLAALFGPIITITLADSFRNPAQILLFLGPFLTTCFCLIGYNRPILFTKKAERRSLHRGKELTLPSKKKDKN